MEKKLTNEERQVVLKELKDTLTEQLENIFRIIVVARKIDATNEQFFIEYENWLNKLSTLDHTEDNLIELFEKLNLDKNILV